MLRSGRVVGLVELGSEELGLGAVTKLSSEEEWSASGATVFMITIPGDEDLVESSGGGGGEIGVPRL